MRVHFNQPTTPLGLARMDCRCWSWIPYNLVTVGMWQSHCAMWLSDFAAMAKGAFGSPTQKTVSLENDRFRPFQNGRPLHRSMWCLALPNRFQETVANGRNRPFLKRTSRGPFHDRFSTRRPHPFHTPLSTHHFSHIVHITFHTPPQPPHLFTILATALQRHRKIQHRRPHTSTGRPPTTIITVHDACDRSRASQKNIAHAVCNGNCNL